MYNILAVDDDRTCLLILKTCLKKWGYQVTAVEHADEALSMLENKSFDLVITDIHMPDMNGFELQERINKNFMLPVIMISADSRAQVMCIGIKNGAQRFFVKPVMANDLKDIWQVVEWWKRTRSNNSAPLTQINASSQERPTIVIDSHRDNDNNTFLDNTTGRKRNRLVWTSDLHNRFLEAILIIGYHRAVPTNILEVMNVEGLTRGQVASHLQKFQKFLGHVLAGKSNIEFSYWTDSNYQSEFVFGNPNLLLLNQLRNEHRKGNLAAHNPLRPPKQGNINITARAPNVSLSSLPRLPRLTLEGSSSRAIYAALMQELDYSTNVASPGLGSINSPKAHTENMGNIIGSNTSNFIHNLSDTTNEDCFHQNTLAQQHDNYSKSANNYMPLSENHVALSSKVHFQNNLNSYQSIDVGEDNYNFSHGNNFNEDQLTQLGNKHGDPNIDISSHGNYFENSSTMNSLELDGEILMDGSWFNDIWREDGNDYSLNNEIDEDEDVDHNREDI